MTVRYQFQVDGRGFGAPIRDKWEDAAQDAVNAGYASWSRDRRAIRVGDQAAVARIFPDRRALFPDAHEEIDVSELFRHGRPML